MLGRFAGISMHFIGVFEIHLKSFLRWTSSILMELVSSEMPTRRSMVRVIGADIASAILAGPLKRS